jgi:hypothetical protein
MRAGTARTYPMRIANGSRRLEPNELVTGERRALGIDRELAVVLSADVVFGVTRSCGHGLKPLAGNRRHRPPEHSPIKYCAGKPASRRHARNRVLTRTAAFANSKSR